MTAIFILAALLLVLGVVAGEVGARRYRSRVVDARRLRRSAPKRVRERW